jgi:hypothetical protein
VWLFHLYLVLFVWSALSMRFHCRIVLYWIKTPRSARRGHGKPARRKGRPGTFGTGPGSHQMGREPRPRRSACWRNPVASAGPQAGAEEIYPRSPARPSPKRRGC